MGDVAALNTAFMISSMVGFLLSVLYVPRFSQTWAVTFCIFFIIMFIASLISMVKGMPDSQLLPRPRRK